MSLGRRRLQLRSEFELQLVEFGGRTRSGLSWHSDSFTSRAGPGRCSHGLRGGVAIKRGQVYRRTKGKSPSALFLCPYQCDLCRNSTFPLHKKKKKKKNLAEKCRDKNEKKPGQKKKIESHNEYIIIIKYQYSALNFEFVKEIRWFNFVK